MLIIKENITVLRQLSKVHECLYAQGQCRRSCLIDNIFFFMIRLGKVMQYLDNYSGRGEILFLSEQIKDDIIKYLQDKLDPKFIYLFGSIAKGEGRKDSDIDLGVYLDRIISPYDLLVISNNLANKLNRDVQIVNLKDVSTVFAAQIVSTKEVLYCGDEVLYRHIHVSGFCKETGVTSK